jgi:hypothetical protein
MLIALIDSVVLISTHVTAFKIRTSIQVSVTAGGSGGGFRGQRPQRGGRRPEPAGFGS